MKTDTAILKFIELTEDKKEVRFFVAGIYEDNVFTGIMHDYVGGGNYEEALVYKNQWIPTEDKDDEPLEWSEQVEMFDQVSSVTVDEIENILSEYLYYDADTFNNYIPNGVVPIKEDSQTLIDDTPDFIPYGLGLTTYLDGYAISSECNI